MSNQTFVPTLTIWLLYNKPKTTAALILTSNMALVYLLALGGQGQGIYFSAHKFKHSGRISWRKLG